MIFSIFRFFFAPSDFQILSKPYINGNIIYSAFIWCINLNLLTLMTGFVLQGHNFNVILALIRSMGNVSNVILFCFNELKWLLSSLIDVFNHDMLTCLCAGYEPCFWSSAASDLLLDERLPLVISLPPLLRQRLHVTQLLLLQLSTKQTQPHIRHHV